MKVQVKCYCETRVKSWRVKGAVLMLTIENRMAGEDGSTLALLGERTLEIGMEDLGWTVCMGPVFADCEMAIG